MGNKFSELPSDAQRDLASLLLQANGDGFNNAEKIKFGFATLRNGNKVPDGFKKKNWQRNKPCLCGSGKKFKVCCWSRCP